MGGGLEYECQRKTGAVLVVNGIERLVTVIYRYSSALNTGIIGNVTF